MEIELVAQVMISLDNYFLTNVQSINRHICIYKTAMIVSEVDTYILKIVYSQRPFKCQDSFKCLNETDCTRNIIHNFSKFIYKYQSDIEPYIRHQNNIIRSTYIDLSV